MCNCRVSSKYPCCGNRCFWRSNDLHYVAACGESVSLPQMILIKLKSFMMTCVILYLTYWYFHYVNINFLLQEKLLKQVILGKMNTLHYKRCLWQFYLLTDFKERLSNTMGPAIAKIWYFWWRKHMESA